MPMTLRLSDDESAALRRRAELESRSMIYRAAPGLPGSTVVSVRACRSPHTWHGFARPRPTAEVRAADLERFGRLFRNLAVPDVMTRAWP